MIKHNELKMKWFNNKLPQGYYIRNLKSDRTLTNQQEIFVGSNKQDAMILSDKILEQFNEMLEEK